MKGYSCQLVVDEAIDLARQETRRRLSLLPQPLVQRAPRCHCGPRRDRFSSMVSSTIRPPSTTAPSTTQTEPSGDSSPSSKQLGELDNTIIHYSSDNGSYRQDRSGELRGKKGSHHEGGHRVPGDLLLEREKFIGGRVEKEPAGAVDLLPTLCGLLGIDKPKVAFLDGSDLTPLLTRTGRFERHQPLFWMNGSTMAHENG